jgi:hypothetical protein
MPLASETVITVAARMAAAAKARDRTVVGIFVNLACAPNRGPAVGDLLKSG